MCTREEQNGSCYASQVPEGLGYRHGRHSGRRPGARLCADHNLALAEVERLRPGRRSDPAPVDAGGGREGARLQDQHGDDRPQRPAAAGDGGDPGARRRRHHHDLRQQGAALCRQLRRRVGGVRGDRRRAGRLLRPRQGQHARRQEVDCRPLLHHRRDGRLPQIVVRRDRRHEVPRDLGRISRSRQEAQGQGPAARADARPHGRRRAGLRLSLPVVVGRARSRGRRQDRQAQHARRRSSR